MRVLYRVRPYEKNVGSANELHQKWNEICKKSVRKGNLIEYKRIVRDIVKEFDNLPINNLVKPRVGLVGEILVKFHPQANNNIVDVIEAEGAEAVMPDLLDFFLYSAYDSIYKHDKLAATSKKARNGKIVIAILEKYRKPMKQYLEKSNRFTPPSNIYDMAENASKILQLGNCTGEGWFLTAEMIELINEGAPNIVCMQPFACLPNHVTGKGMIKALRKHYPESNIVAVDYDPGASEVNQLNRIRLMLSTAFKRLNNSEQQENN